ncbi:rhamnan synthesis F family protein [Rodentibacter haemolyticus]|uniref:Rhamnan synthesis protein F n=1 Tax=Rodentibacter haemolyticus TaxID=2778911 RepID=A0ABX6UYJ8_9PAST|nr:rhamnan synthesis F family protein [Rodentibacter haemolyticus]QPB43163.1 hypothetical protein IHV77_03400 [Rodentibacter haemolyticus]
MRRLLQALKIKLKLHLTLFLLSWVRFKMYFEAKKYAKKYKNGTIKFIDEYSEFDLNTLTDKKLILFVVYQPKSELMYERYFDFLSKLGRYIIVVSNGCLSRDFIEHHKDRAILFGERYNIGRDFGVYKEFIQLLRAKSIQPKDLIICNDSIFANLKQNDTRFIEFMQKTEQDDFVGAAEFFGEPNYHVQSYFLKFSSKVLNGKNFIKFWENFFITDNRRANIHNGEIKLSQAIIKDGFKPRVFLGTDNVINKIVDNKQNLFRFLSEFSANHHLDGGAIDWAGHFNHRWFAMNANDKNKPLSPENYALQIELLKIDIAKLINRSGIISISPFFIVDEFGFPFLKRDLVYHEIIDWMLIRQHSKNFDQDLLEEYIDDQRLRKRPWFLSLKEWIMFKSGMI